MADGLLPWHTSGGVTRVTYTGLTGERRQTWRQIGWVGQTGTPYALRDKKGVSSEPGGYAILWLLVEDEPTPVIEEADRG